MAKPIDVKTRFVSNCGKAEDECVAIIIRGVTPTNEKIRILNVNELASTNEVLTNLQSAGLTVKNVSHEKCSVDIPLFSNKNNGNMIAWVKKIENTEPMFRLSGVTEGFVVVSVVAIWA